MSFVQFTIPLAPFALLGMLLLNSIKDHRPKYRYKYLVSMPIAVAISTGSILSLIAFALIGDALSAVFGFISGVCAYYFTSRLLWMKEGMFSKEEIFVPAQWSNISSLESDPPQQDPPSSAENN